MCWSSAAVVAALTQAAVEALAAVALVDIPSSLMPTYPRLHTQLRSALVVQALATIMTATQVLVRSVEVTSHLVAAAVATHTPQPKTAFTAEAEAALEVLAEAQAQEAQAN